MNRSVFAILVLMMTTAYSLNAQLKIMSYNIRFDNPDDGKDRWELRKEELCELLNEQSPDFIGLQESVPGQVDYIDQKLPDYSFIGFGRDGKGTNSESVPLFYNRSKYELLRSEVFWLSETPGLPSKGWDAALNRITTYGVFTNKKSADTLHVFNTHFDHRGQVSRKKAAELIAEKMQSLHLKDKKVILMGDLNSEPDEEPVVILSKTLQDAFLVAKNGRSGPVGTFNAFNVGSEPKGRIDYVFCRNLEVLTYLAVDRKRSNGRWISDHLPVIVELDL